MKLLLDTSALLHWIGDSPKISQRLHSLIVDERNSIFFSPLSVWEARIKWAKGKLDLPDGLLESILTMDFVELRFTSAHAEDVGLLPHIHSDPFDRGLIAQARVEGLSLVTSDRLLTQYDVQLEIV